MIAGHLTTGLTSPLGSKLAPFKQPSKPSIKLILTPVKPGTSALPSPNGSPAKSQTARTKASLKRKAESHPHTQPRIQLRVVCLSEQQSPTSSRPNPAALLSSTPFKLLRSAARAPKRKKIAKPSAPAARIELDWNSTDLVLFKSIDLAHAHLTDPTERKAFSMIEWSLMTNQKLRKDYELTELLGFGGCGSVLAGTRRKDRERVCLYHVFDSSLTPFSSN
jgi:hypothetical protein